MSPELRRDLLLDAAARIVSAEGGTAATMERVSIEANVSKALTYAYFRNRTTLLAALLLREYPAFSGTKMQPVDKTRRLEQIVRETTASYIEHVAEKGVLLQRLMAEPAIVTAVTGHHQLGREATARFFGAQMAQDHDIEPELAVQAADVLMGVTGAAGRIVNREARHSGQMADLVARIIMAAVRELEHGSHSAA